jgi:hypothetical protein
MPTVEKLNFRFSEHHINRLADLSCQTGLTKTDVLRLLLDQADVLIPHHVGRTAVRPSCMVLRPDGLIVGR